MNEKLTMRELLNYFEGYYGEIYFGVLLDTMLGYLEGRSSEFYEAAADVITSHYSRSWNKAPGKAEFEKYMDEILLAMPKPKYLPEPEEAISDEERADWIKKLKRAFSKKSGPMTTALAGLVTNLE